MTELFVLVVLIVVTFAPDARPAQKEGVPCLLGYSAKALKVKPEVTQFRNGKSFLFHIEKIDVITEDQLESVRNLLAEYERLRGKI